MKRALLVAFASVALAAGCSTFSQPHAPGDAALPAAVPHLNFTTPTPAPKHLYVSHDGIFFEYALPLGGHSQPLVAATELPGAAIAPVMTADQFGNVAVASPTQVTFFHPPIRSFDPKRAYLTLALTPAITQVGQSGAVLADVEWDPNENFWLLNNIGGEITMLQAPLRKQSVASVVIAFTAPGLKSASYPTLVNARFDVNSALYVYATAPTTGQSLLFKSSFPYAKPPSGVVGLNLSAPDFVDASQWPNGPPISFSGGALYGQYLGLLASPPPQQPPPPPTPGLAQFTQPFFPNPAVYPDAMISMIAGDLVADANRGRLYTLDAATGALDVFPMPFSNHQKPILKLRCAARTAIHCSERSERLFLAP